MKTFTSNLNVAAMIGFLLMLPFAALEFMLNAANRRNLSDFPLPLFGLLWLLPMLFLLIGQPLVHDLRTETRSMATPRHLLWQVALLALIAVLWIGVLTDQMPCFLGVPNCD